MTMLKEVEIGAALKAYYPWTSMENNGLQPVQAIEIVLNSKLFFICFCVEEPIFVSLVLFKSFMYFLNFSIL